MTFMAESAERRQRNIWTKEQTKKASAASDALKMPEFDATPTVTRPPLNEASFSPFQEVSKTPVPSERSRHPEKKAPQDESFVPLINAGVAMSKLGKKLHNPKMISLGLSMALTGCAIVDQPPTHIPTAEPVAITQELTPSPEPTRQEPTPTPTETPAPAEMVQPDQGTGEVQQEEVVEEESQEQKESMSSEQRVQMFLNPEPGSVYEDLELPVFNQFYYDRSQLKGPEGNAPFGIDYIWFNQETHTGPSSGAVFGPSVTATPTLLGAEEIVNEAGQSISLFTFGAVDEYGNRFTFLASGGTTDESQKIMSDVGLSIIVYSEGRDAQVPIIHPERSVPVVTNKQAIARLNEFIAEGPVQVAVIMKGVQSVPENFDPTKYGYGNEFFDAFIEQSDPQRLESLSRRYQGEQVDLELLRVIELLIPKLREQ
jgi:hypothetical protein